MQINLGGNAVSICFSSLGMKGFFVYQGAIILSRTLNEWILVGSIRVVPRKPIACVPYEGQAMGVLFLLRRNRENGGSYENEF